MAMMQEIQMPRPGDRIGSVCGPGEFPQDNSGIVIAVCQNQWGPYALVLMNNGEMSYCHGLNSGPGIGWHLVQRGSNAIVSHNQ